MQKNSKVVNVLIRFQEEGSLVYKNCLSEQVFGKWMHFQISLWLREF